MSTEQKQIQLDYISSFEELLAGARSADPKQTKVDAFQLPHSADLYPQFVFTFSGPEAAEVAGFIYQQLGSLAQKCVDAMEQQPQG